MARLTKFAVVAAGGAAAYMAFRSVQRTAEIKRYMGVATGKRILILGAGFGGMAAAAELGRLLPSDGNGEITLIDEDNFLLFTPMLTEAAGGQLDPRHIAVSVRQLPARVRFVQGVIQSIDLENRSVSVAIEEGAAKPVQITLQADHIVIALGSVTNFHHVQGARKNTLQLKRLGDASEICRRVLANIERATEETDPEKRRAMLTFVVAGGGYTGVETMAAVNDLLRSKAAEYGLRSEEVRTVLVNPGERLLTETSPELAAYAAEKLSANGVEILMKKAVSSITPEMVRIRDGEQISCHTVVWAAGVKPSPALEGLPCEKGKHGGIKTNHYCQVPHFNGIWAVGDCAEIPEPDNAGTYAPIAQNATREGTLVARNIVAQFSGERFRPFAYKPVGELALVGKRAGVARLLGVNLHGTMAWALWRAVYLAKIPGVQQKVRVATDWLLDVLLGREAIPVGDQPTTHEVQTATAQHT